MRLKVQLVISADDDGTDTIHDVAVLEKDCQRLEQLGLTLAEAKQLLTRLQQHVVAHQATAFVTTRSHCQACGTPLQRKEQTTRVLRTLFGRCSSPVLGSITAFNSSSHGLVSHLQINRVKERPRGRVSGLRKGSHEFSPLESAPSAF